MKHTQLKQEDLVIFLIKDDLSKEEVYEQGSVIKVYSHNKSIDILWLEGYRSRVDNVPFNKVIAKYDKNGEQMKFDVFSGPSVLLEL